MYVSNMVDSLKQFANVQIIYHLKTWKLSICLSGQNLGIFELNFDQPAVVMSLVLCFWKIKLWRFAASFKLRVNSSREHPPGQTPRHTRSIWKNCSNARPSGQSFLANVPSPFLLRWSMPGPPVLLINIQNYFKIAIFSSIKLHKTGHEMIHSDRKKTKQKVLLFLKVFYGR